MRRPDELRELLCECAPSLATELDEDTSLIASGRLDSVALFNLVVWIEAQIGRAIDPTAVEPVREWDSMRRIREYIRRSGAGTQPASAVLAAQMPPHGDGIDVVEYSPARKQAVLELQARLWSPDAALNCRYFEWKYERNPYASDPRIYLVVDHGEVVGMRGFYASRWEMADPPRIADVLVADDLVLREDRRDQGLVTRLMRASLEDLRRRGADYVFNLSGSPITVLGSVAMGWRSAGHLEAIGRSSIAHASMARLAGVLARLPLAGRFGVPRRMHLSGPRRPFARLDAQPNGFTGDGPTVRVERRARPAAMADLVGRRPRDARIRHVRDAAFFAWRFENPLHEYRFLYVGGERLDGYLVLRHVAADRGSRRVSIVDLEAIDDPTRHALVSVAARRAGLDELTTWSATLDPSTVSDLRRLGFGPIDPHRATHGCPCILVRPTDDARLDDDWHIHGVRLLDLANWDHRMLYTMAG